MKKYLFGILAIVFALSTVAFTNAKRANEKNFKFIGSVSDDTQVENPLLWKADASTISCDGTNNQACRITEVPDTHYHQSGSDFYLNATTLQGTVVSITAGQSGSVYFVNSVSIGTRTNKSL